MLNKDKSILIAYLDVTRLSREKGIAWLHQFKSYIEDKFINTKEINDDSLVILVVPADRTEMVLLNAKYPNYEQMKKDAEQILNDYINKEKIS